MAGGILLLLCSHLCYPISEVNVLPDFLRLITAQPTSKWPLQTKTIPRPWSVKEAHLPDSAARRGGGWRRCEARNHGVLSRELNWPLQPQVNNILPGHGQRNFHFGLLWHRVTYATGKEASRPAKAGRGGAQVCSLRRGLSLVPNLGND